MFRTGIDRRIDMYVVLWGGYLRTMMYDLPLYRFFFSFSMRKRVCIRLLDEYGKVG